ncbi:MAG: hypothetical protein U0169_04190 [Polyangiaceae bacterium]
MRLRVVASAIALALGTGCGGPGSVGPVAPGSVASGPSKDGVTRGSLVANARLVGARRIGALLAGDAVRGVAFANDGDVVVTGSFEDTVDFGGTRLTSRGGSDVFVAKYARTGTLRWVRRFGGSKTDRGQSVALLPDGSIFVAGSFMATADFGKKELTTAGNGGASDLFVSRLAPSGTPEWTRALGNDADDGGFSLAVDERGVVVAGVLGKSDGAATTPGIGRDTDALVAAWTLVGDRSWQKTFGNAGTDLAGAVALDAAGDAYVLSDFALPVPAAGGIAGTGPHALTLTKLGRDGSVRWESSVGCESMVNPEAVVVAKDGAVHFAGSLYANATWNGTTIEVPGAGAGLVGSVSREGKRTNLVTVRSSGGASLTALAVDTKGRVVAGGHGDGTLDVAGHPFEGRALYTFFVGPGGTASDVAFLPVKKDADRIARIVATDDAVALVGTLASEVALAKGVAPLLELGGTDGFLGVFAR